MRGPQRSTALPAQLPLDRQQGVEQLARRRASVSSRAAPLRNRGWSRKPTGSVSRSDETASDAHPLRARPAAAAPRRSSPRGRRGWRRGRRRRVVIRAGALDRDARPPRPAARAARRAWRRARRTRVTGKRASSASATAGGERLEQAVRAPVRDLAHGRRDVAVVDRVLDPVARRSRLADLELDVEEEALALSPLLVEDAVEALQLEPAQLDPLTLPPPPRRSAPRRARGRRARGRCDAPRSKAATAAPTDAAAVPVVALGSPSSFPSVLFRESPTSTGRPSAVEHVEPANELEVLRRRLAEAEAGVEADVLLGDALRDREREPLLEERGDLRRDVVVARVGLHRPRLALHVHQADVRARRRRRRRRGPGRRGARSRR